MAALPGGGGSVVLVSSPTVFLQTPQDSWGGACLWPAKRGSGQVPPPACRFRPTPQQRPVKAQKERVSRRSGIPAPATVALFGNGTGVTSSRVMALSKQQQQQQHLESEVGGALPQKQCLAGLTTAHLLQASIVTVALL